MQSKPKLRTSAPEEQSVFRGILEAPRPKSKGDDDAPKRRHRIEKGRHRVTNREQILHERESEYVDLCLERWTTNAIF